MEGKAIDHASRQHALLSASSAHRWLNCPPSAVASELYPRTDTIYTREGTTAHEVAEIYARGDYTAPSEKYGITPEMMECAEGYRDYLQELIKVENPLILTEQRVNFSPWVPGGYGTADRIIIQGREMDVIDYKFGRGIVEAENNPQLRLYGLGALNDYGFAYDIETVRLHIYQPRVKHIDVDEWTAAELLAWGDRIKPTAETAEKGEGDYSPGTHCTFCPHAGNCKALNALCTRYVKQQNLKIAVPVLAPYEVAEALRMEPMIDLWLKRVKEQALADMLGGADVPGYKVVEGKPGNRKWADELQVAEKLRDAGYQLNDITETKLLSPAAMEKSIGKKNAAELLADMIERAPGAPTVAPVTDKRKTYSKTNI